MKHIVLKSKSATKSSTIFLSICNRCLKIEEEHALLENGYWEEYPVAELARAEIYKNLSIELQSLEKLVALRRIVKLGLFEPKLNKLLTTYNVVKNYCDDTVIS